jgi:hypothetical protein
MRYLFKFLLLTTFCHALVHAQEYQKVQADMHNYLLNMKTIVTAGVQSRTDWQYIIQNGNLTTDCFKERVLKYDIRGRIKECENIDKNGIIQSILVFRYDNQNLPVMETEFMPTGEMIAKTKYTYDLKGRLQDITWLNNNEFIIRKNTYEIDENAKSITERQFTSPDSVVKKTTYIYTDLNNGLIREEWSYKGENILDFKKIVNQNNTDKIEIEEYRNSDGELTFSLKYDYDTNGNLIAVLSLFPDGTEVKKFDYNYGNSGLITGEIKYNQKGEIIQFHKYSYD